MKNITLLVEFELNDASLIEDWKKMSATITKQLTTVDGFISRDSAIDKNGKIYCIVKWENMEKQAAFRKILESDEFKDSMVEFGRIANMATMKESILEIL